MTIVQPETAARWHRAGFRRYWRWNRGGGEGDLSLPKIIPAFSRRLRGILGALFSHGR